MFVAQPAGRHLVDADFEEAGRPVIQLHDPALGACSRDVFGASLNRASRRNQRLDAPDQASEGSSMRRF